MAVLWGMGGAFTDLLGTSCGDSALSDSETREGPRWLSPGVPCGAVCSVPFLYCDWVSPGLELEDLAVTA